MQKNISFKSVRLLILMAFVVTSSLIMYGCNDSANEPAETESPTNTDSINAVDTTNRMSDTLSSDTTKGGQPAPPR